MTGDRERSPETPPPDAWARLGRLLRQRRPLLEARYRIRRVFADENGLTDKTVQEIENAYRQTFSDEMLALIERAYQLPTDTIVDFIADPEARKLPDPTPRVATAPAHETALPVDLPPEVSLEDLPPDERGIWLLPNAGIEERQMLIHWLRVVRGDRGESLDFLFSALAALVRQRNGHGPDNETRHVS